MTGHNSTLSSFLGYYCEKRKQKLSWAARDQTKYAFRQLIGALGDIPIADITVADAEDWQEYVADLTSKQTANSYLKAVRPCFNWAVRREMIEANPFEKLRPYRVTKPEIRVFDGAEVRAILAAAKNEMWRARIIAALSAGLRKGEVLNLTLNDIDFDKQMIMVRPKKDDPKAGTWQWEAKDYEIRRLPLVPELHNLLVSKILPSLPAGQPYVMLSEKRYFDLRKRIGSLPERIRKRPDENSKPFRRILDHAQISNGCFHDLRKTAITRWTHYLPIQEVRRLAGHGDVSTTLKYYAGVRPDILERATAAYVGATGLEPATS
jgi:integrase